MLSLGPLLADWSRSSDQLLQLSLNHPGPLTLGLVFIGGLLTSFGPCSLSLLPVTLAYLAGFGASPPHAPPWPSAPGPCRTPSPALAAQP